MSNISTVFKTSIVIQNNPLLELRPPKVEMAIDFLNVIKREREYLEQWLPWVRNMHAPVEARQYLFEMERFNEGGQRWSSIIFLGNQLVGSVAFVQIKHRHKTGELGYWISRNFQGQGFVTLACRHAIKIGFEQLDLERIEIKTSGKNLKSQRLADRLGFTLEGILRKAYHLNGAILNVAIYGLLKSEWENK